MNSDFPRILSFLRKEKKISQKNASEKLGISQSLLSHYEKGIRECGLDFVVKAANFYDVSCDYLLGKSPERKGRTISLENLDSSMEQGERPSSKNLNLIYKKKILFCSLNILVDIIAKTKNNNLIEEIFNFFNLAAYRIFRIIFKLNKHNNSEMFSLKDNVANQYAQASMIKSEANANLIATELALQTDKKTGNSDDFAVSTDVLELNYGTSYNALLNLVKNCELKINDKNQ